MHPELINWYSEPRKCPRCGGTEFTEFDCGPDSYENDIFYTSYKCKRCGLWYDSWREKWYVGVDSWRDVEDAEEYK